VYLDQGKKLLKTVIERLVAEGAAQAIEDSLPFAVLWTAQKLIGS
jgi:hypothetical protein